MYLMKIHGIQEDGYFRCGEVKHEIMTQTIWLEAGSYQKVYFFALDDGCVGVQG